MAKEREITTKFKVDISDLKAGIQEANRHIRLANSEFKAATAGMDKWSESADGLKAKIKQLNSVIAAEKDKLKILEEQYSRVAKECGESSREAEEMAIKLNNQKAAVGRAEASLKKYTKQLDDVKNGATSFDKVGKAAKGAADDIDDANNSLKRLSDGFTVMKGAMATFVGNAMTGLVNSVKDGVVNLLQLSETTREYREDLGKLETAFEDAKVSTQVATDTYKDFYSVLGEEDRSVEAVNHLAKFVDTEQDMAKWTDICTGVWGTFGDSLPIEGLTEAANETMKTGKITGVLADALVWAGVNEEEFQESLDKCTTEQERQALITDKLNGLYSDAAKSYRENNKSIIESRKATSEYQTTLAKLGEKMEPVTTAMTKGFTKILNKVLELVEGVDMDKFIDSMSDGFDYVANKVMPKLINAIKVATPLIMNAIKWVIDNSGVLANILATVGTVMVGLKIGQFVTTIINLATKIKNVGSILGVLKIALAALGGPVTVVVAIIGTLIAAFVALWNKSEGFRNFWIGLWEGLKNVVNVAVEGIKNMASGIVDFMKSAWENIKLAWSEATTFFSELWELIKLGASECWENVKAFFSSAWEFIKSIWNGAVEFFSGIWQGIVSIFSVITEVVGGFFSSAWEFIKSIWNSAISFFSGLFSNIVSIISNALGIVKQFFLSAWENIKSIWDAVKPYFEVLSNAIKKIFEKLGEIIAKIFELAWATVKGIWNLATSFFKKLFVKVKDIISEAANKIVDFLSGAWDKIKSIWSTVSGFFSDLWNGIKNIFGDVANWFGNIFSGAWENIKSKFSEWGDFWSGLWTQVKNKFSDIGANIGSTISDSIKNGLNAVLGFIEGTINKGIRLINGAIKLANLLPGVDVGTIDEISLPRLYKGGVLKKGQVGLLEGSGAEAVVPLENNKKWIRKTAKDMTRELSLQKSMDVKQSQPVQHVTNNYFTQNNTSPKALSRLEIYRQTNNQLALLRG